ncbi:DUF1003 domain-containing protein [Deinococcus sonorensis]|uniref:DUF1003 domain-containing protein n=2 Tax=Deinococcus sonorensis TaxID=309891 RepID=A0AAU7U4X5_9DEIO
MAQAHDDRFAQLIEGNAEINALLRQQAEAGLTNLHRPIERLGALLVRPVFLVVSLTVAVLWVLLNLDLKVVTSRPWDAPPFFWLQGLVGVLSLITTATVLVSQARQAQLAEQRAQLQLQVILLTEQRTAKLIGLLEELRRDLPNVHDRPDLEAEVMQQASSPQAILEAIVTQDDAGTEER